MKTTNHLIIIHDLRSSRNCVQSYYNYGENESDRRSFGNYNPIGEHSYYLNCLKWRKDENLYIRIKDVLIKNFEDEFNKIFKEEFSTHDYFLNIIFDHKIILHEKLFRKTAGGVWTTMIINLKENKKEIYSKRFLIPTGLSTDMSIDFNTRITELLDKIVDKSISVLLPIFAMDEGEAYEQSI